MVLEVREYYVVVHAVPVHAYKIEEYIVVVTVAVDYHCGSLCFCGFLGGNIAGVDLHTVVAKHECVLENSDCLEAVIPGGAAGHEGVCLMACAFNVSYAVRFEIQGIIRHELSGKAGRCGNSHQGQRRSVE